MPASGTVRTLELLVGRAKHAGLTLHLFSNDVTPKASDTLDSYIEVIGGGYVPKPLDPADWLIDSGEPSIAQHPPQEFLFSGIPDVISVFGYFITQGSLLLWAERFVQTESPFFQPPFIVTGLGDKIIVTPVFTMGAAEV
jgi:hypothetical protein